MTGHRDPDRSPLEAAHPATEGFLPILFAFLRLGVTSFGGPIAHLGYFRAAFVARRRWLSEPAYADIVALAQFLPGPASSQTGFAIGIMRGGLAGGLAAWVGFTLPSAMLMLAAAHGLALAGTGVGAGIVHGLKLVAAAVVAQAVWGMAASLCPDRVRATVAVAAAVGSLLLPSAATQLAVIACGGLVGARFCRNDAAERAPGVPASVGRRTAIVALAVFVLLLAGLPFAAAGGHALALTEACFRAGALVFGGGHVVLPLLERSFVPTGWISEAAFLAGYGAAQALPGPLFAFAAFLGAAQALPPNGVGGGLIALVAIFLPGLLLMLGALPFWATVRGEPRAQAALAGVNAAVVGILLAALYDPIVTSAVRGPADMALALAGFAALMIWKVPVWIVVALTALGGLAVA